MGKFTARDWVLAMLYLVGGRVRGRTRFHKGIFLVSMEVDNVDTPVFEPHDFGPWSYEVDMAIKDLIKDGLVVMHEEPGGDESPAQVFELTGKGAELARKVVERLGEHPEFGRIRMRLEFAGKAPIMNVLAYVYGMYPEYTVKSRIKRKVSLWRRIFS